MNDHRRVYIWLYVVAERAEPIFYLKYLFLRSILKPTGLCRSGSEQSSLPRPATPLFSVSSGKYLHDKFHTVSSLHCRQPTANTQTAQCTVFCVRHSNSTLNTPPRFNPQGTIIIIIIIIIIIREALHIADSRLLRKSKLAIFIHNWHGKKVK